MVSATTFTREYGHALSLLTMVYFHSVAREGARAVGVFMITCTSVLSVSKA
jgi:hypothetical protein